ncbi:hypothetical protein DdX_19081 [Ditylenchus destructor]|uniref:Uncharacterized protein n=1 Tax=Ditylenchus destructor TaxID=166010 RepID=A0AAD4MNA4_9BILA|nr:hypothetical protein DdX_19081 [Ditylenchus destructor]
MGETTIPELDSVMKCSDKIVMTPLGGIQNEMTFGVADNFTFPEGTVFDGTVDGFVGLSNDDVVCDTYLPPVFKQIEASLHRPMFSLYTNRDFALNGTVTLFDTAVPIVDVEGTDVITIGDDSSLMRIPKIVWMIGDMFLEMINPFQIPGIKKLSYKTETPIPKQSVISLNTSLVFVDISLCIFTSNEAVRDIFVEASGVYFNSTLNLYEAECQRAYSKDDAVWLRIGENGTEMELGLWWRDYIRTEYIPEPSLGSDGEIMRCFLDVYLLPRE